VWLHVLRTCVCIAVFDFRAYDVQLKTKLQFKVSDDHVTPPVNPDNTAPQLWLVRALTIVSDFFSGRTLGLTSNQLQQLPTGVFSSLTSLRSLTCVVACIENVCVHSCV
jgi:hypothetical protein